VVVPLVVVAVAASAEDADVGPRAKVSPILFPAVVGDGIGAAALELGELPGGGTRGNVSPLLPELLSVGFGAFVPGVEGKDWTILGNSTGVELGGCEVVEVVSCVVVNVVNNEVVCITICVEVPLTASGVGELSEFAAGIEGNSVRGGELPGSLGTAGTIPIIPDGCCV
jgi:hypothetical protein